MWRAAYSRRRNVAIVTSDSGGAARAGPHVPGPPDLPAIPVSAGALIFDRENRLLILKPTYKSGWTIPGGVMEADGETPWQACQREVREETGIEVRRGQLACMDFRAPARASRGVSGSCSVATGSMTGTWPRS